MDITPESRTTWPPRIWLLKSAIVVGLVFIAIYVGLSVVQGVLLMTSDTETLSFGASVLAVVATILAAVVAVLVGKAMRGFSWQEFGFRRTQTRWYVLAVVLAPGLAIARMLVAGLLLLGFPGLNAGVEELGDLLISDDNQLQTLVIAALAAFVVPISEEMFFRGYLHNALRMRLPVWGGILLSSAIFAAVHLIPLQIVTAFVIAVALAWLYEASGSLVPCIILHVANNAFALALAGAANWVLQRFPDLATL